ncbi:MAG: tetraacyldisaccharide 4'-kinase [Gallionellaceae bacterium]|nr:tetraacyldisaccharide 4'-kinase [Gallionellaceae bacterium]
MSLERRLLDCWYGRAGWCLALLPLAWLFGLAAALRRLYYRLRPPVPLPVPVIVVGNLSVGGTGKTPLTLWLVDRLRAVGHRPGVLSRGYGGAGVPAAVGVGSDATAVGDEPVLIARRAGCPVWVGRHRRAAGLALLAAHTEVDVLIADDGLQHYALARDFEIAVLDGQRGLGNGHLLPAGPLREPPARLAVVDAVVVNGDGEPQSFDVPAYAMRLGGVRLYNLARPGQAEAPAVLAGRPLHAVAAIGNPQRFFDTLARLGLDAVPQAFPDHHRYRPDDLPPGDVIMTEKDAVKCAGFGRDDIWVLAVDAEVAGGLDKQVLTKLEHRHG